MAFLFTQSCRFFLLLIFFYCFLSFIPFNHSLSTVSISETSNQTMVCALIQTRSYLNCTSFPAGSLALVHPVNVSFSGIVGGDGFLCGLRTFRSSSTSALLCWRFSANGTNVSYRRIYQGPALSELTSGNSHVCGLVNGTNSLLCWQWPRFDSGMAQNFSSLAVGEKFVCGLSATGEIRCSGDSIVGNPPRVNYNYSVIAAGFRHACAISHNNDLVCWGDPNGVGDKPQGKFIAMALGENRNCALRTNETVVCWGASNFSLPESLKGFYFRTIEAKRNVFCGVMKLDYSLFCWGNEMFDSNSMVFKDALPGPCTSKCPWGPLPLSRRFCDQGEFICEPCKTPFIQVPAPMLPPSPSPKTHNRARRSEWNGRMVAFLVVGCVGSVFFLVSFGFFVFRYCRSRGCRRVHDSGPLDERGGAQAEPGGPGGSGQRQGPQSLAAAPVLEKRLSQLTSMGNTGHLEEFPLEVLLQATNNFSEDHKVGSGSFGSVYHATLEDGREVAIKRAETSNNSSYAGGTRRQEDKDAAFISELDALSRLHHKNLVRLYGFCEDCNERVLVYEHMTNGTLHDHLHKLQTSPLMSWAARVKVALDAARGIEYLHEYAVPRIIHRDIKSSNILLDANWTAKVSDFGLSLMGPEDDESHLSLRAAGTVGYMDPEYYRFQQLTTKSDVYSFGIVLLELLSGYKAIHRNENGDPRNVVDFVLPYILQDEIHRVLDVRVPPPTPFEIEAVAFVGYLAADCIVVEGRDRPSMTEIVDSLERALHACLIHHPPVSRSTTGSSA